jgi:hypothetical protein
VKEDSENVDGQIEALNALNSMRVEERQLREEITSNVSRLLSKKGVTLSPHSALSGLRSLAESPLPLDDKLRLLSSRLSQHLDPTTFTSFSDHLTAVWSLCALQQYDAPALGQSLKYINSLTFERLDNDLKYEEYLRLVDVHNALRFESPRQLGHALTPENLLVGLQSQQTMLELRFKEHGTRYDPFKQRVVQAIAKGLTNASVEH